MSEPVTRDEVLQTLRKRGVAIGDLGLRERLADAAVEWGPAKVDWDAMDTYFLARFWREPKNLSGAFLGALRDRQTLEDSIFAAREHHDQQLERELARDPGAYRRDDTRAASTRPPIALCFCPDPMRDVTEEPLGAPIGQWFDQTESTPDFQGRWFCRRCGREWVRTPHGTAGFKTSNTPFGGAADMSVGLRPYTPPPQPEKTRRKAKQA